MYKKVKYLKSGLKRVDTTEGEPIEHKIERILNNKEPISDSATEIYTEKNKGVQPEYNIKTDRFELAAEGMDRVQRSISAKKEAEAKKNADKLKDKTNADKEAKVLEMKNLMKDIGSPGSDKGSKAEG
jgi:hypothetical protein